MTEKRLSNMLSFVGKVLIVTFLISIFFSHGRVSALSYDVSGTVTNASTAVPVVGANVYAYAPGTDTLEASTTTQSDGTYNLSIASGNYDIRFVPPSSTGLDSVVDPNVSVDEGVIVNEQLTTQQYTFSGTLTDSTGYRITSATVALIDVYGDKFPGTTNSGGNFEVAVKPGMYSLSVSGSLVVPNTYIADSISISQTGTPAINLNSGNITQNLVVPVTTMNYYDTDWAAEPTPLTAYGNTTVSLYAGDPGESADVYTNIYIPSNNSNPRGNFKTISGAAYPSNSICLYGLDGSGSENVCDTNSITMGSSGNNIDVPYVPAPALSVSSPTPEPVLSWTEAGYATSYTIYRDGSEIGTTTSTSFTDSDAPTGTHTYYVTAVDSAGDISGHSNAPTVNVVSGIPALGTPTFSVNPIVEGGSTTVTVPVVGNEYGITGGEYFIGTDPGQGNGTPMTYSNGVLTATITGSIAGNQTVYFRAENSAGWGGTVSAVLDVTVQAPTGLAATTPTSEPDLTWNPVTDASTYDVYRDGSEIGTTSSTSYTDNNVASGSHTYYVVAVDSTGVASSPSSSVGVTVVYAKPVLGNVDFSANPVTEGQSTTVTVDVEGNLYGVTGGEFYVGDTDPGQGNGTVMTYSDGVLTATISGLAIGEQTINFRAENGAGWGDTSSATVDVELPIVSGTITVGGQPLVGARVTIYGNGYPSAITDSNGDYTISSVQPGDYQIYIEYDPSSIYNPGLNLNNVLSTSRIVTVNGDTIVNLAFNTDTLTVAFTYSDGTPITGASVWAMSTTDDSTYTDVAGDTFEATGNNIQSYAYTDSTGTAMLTVIPGQSYSICAIVSHLVYCVADTGTITGNTTFNITAPAPSTYSTFSGIFTDSNGDPIPNATIELLTDGPLGHIDYVTTTTGSDGSFSLSVPSGTYALYVQGIDDGTDFSLGQPGATTGINLTYGNLDQNLVLPVATVDYSAYVNGVPAAGYAISANLGDSNAAWTSLYPGDPGENGDISMQYVTANAQGQGSFESVVGATYSGANIYDGVCVTDYNVCNATPFTVTSGTNMVYIPAPILGTVSGTVTIDGQPVSGATVSIIGTTLTAVTDSNGNYSISSVPDGSYQIGMDYDSNHIALRDIKSTSYILVVNGNTTENLAFDSSTLTVPVNYPSGLPAANVWVVANSYNPEGGISIADNAGDAFTGNTVSSFVQTDATGNAQLTIMSGMDYDICAEQPPLGEGYAYCEIYPVSGDTTASAITVPLPIGPTNLTVSSATGTPVLSWNWINEYSATSYNVYRNGALIATIPGYDNTTYTDSSAPVGTNSYYVTGIYALFGESAPSNTVSVVTAPTTPPTITYGVTPITDSNGYNTGNVLVTFTCTDNSGTGIASCTSPVTVSNEGIGQTITGTATDNAGNTTTITVDPSLLVTAINAGGDASGSYSADTDSYGGTTYTTANAVDTSAVINPAPQDAYQSARYGNSFNYTLPGLTPGASYTLMLQFNEPYWGVGNNGGGVGSRVFDVSVNGTPVLTNFDIYAMAGGANKAITEEIPVTADTNGNVTIQFNTVTDNAIVSGIQLFNGTLPPQAPLPTYTFSTLIDAGGGTVGNFAADSDFSGGTTYTTTSTVDTSDVTNPAPQAVYQSARYGTNFSYTIPDLTPGATYTVQLDFNELYYGVDNNGGGVGSRVFDVAINGTNVLNNFDIYATAGGANIALAEDFTATANAEGQLVIQFTGVTDNAMVSGIEITPTDV